MEMEREGRAVAAFPNPFEIEAIIVVVIRSGGGVGTLKFTLMVSQYPNALTARAIIVYLGGR